MAAMDNKPETATTVVVVGVSILELWVVGVGVQIPAGMGSSLAKKETS